MKTPKSLKTANALRYATRQLDSFVEIPQGTLETLYR